MKISTQKNDTDAAMIVAIEGSIDTVTAPELSKALVDFFPGLKKLILDFTNVDYISSSGLRVILSANKQMSGQGSLLLQHLNPEVREVFEITGFDELLTIE